MSTSSSRDVAVLIAGIMVTVLVIILIATVAILIMVILSLSRKYRREVKERETRIPTSQNVNMVDIDTRANVSYIPMFHQILTEDNAAYGKSRANNNVTAVVSNMEGGSQASATERSEEHHYEDIN